MINSPETVTDAGRNLRMRVAGMILRMCAHRNCSVEDLDADLFNETKVRAFLASVARDDDEADLTLRDIASIAHYLKFDISIEFGPKVEEAVK